MERMMPAQLVPFLAFYALVSCASLELMVAASASSAVSTNSSLRVFCIIGAALGAFISVIAFPPQDPSTRNGLRAGLGKFVGSLSLGVMCGPAASRYLGLAAVDEDLVMIVAGVISLVGIAVLHVTAPIVAGIYAKFIERWLTSKAERYLGDKDNMGGS